MRVDNNFERPPPPPPPQPPPLLMKLQERTEQQFQLQLLYHDCYLNRHNYEPQSHYYH
jgi:hypothetical protein